MRVKELIKKLETMPEEAYVYIKNNDFETPLGIVEVSQVETDEWNLVEVHLRTLYQ